VILHHVTGFGAVRHPPNRSVVARRKDGPIADDDRPDELAGAGRTRGDDLGDVHEVLIPGYPLVHALFLTCRSGSRSDLPIARSDRPSAGITTAFDVMPCARD